MADVEKELKTLRDDMVRLRGDLADLASALKDAGAEKLEGGTKDIRKDIRRGLEDLRGRSRRAVQLFEDEIEERPFTAVLSAFAVGFVLAKLFDRNS